MSRRECESRRPLLSALLDEELTDAERVRLHDHLATCVACQQLLAEYSSVHDRLRCLDPVPSPPPDIWQAVRAEAQKDAQRSWFSRWVRVSAAQLSFSSAAVMLLLVVISGFALFQGYQRSINPAIAASFPNTYQRWPVGEPIKITFNKPMNHESVVENLKIWPAPEEKQRLPMDWQGETLVIQTDPNNGAPLVPDTRYTIIVLPGAADTRGNRLGRAWQLSFEMTSNKPVLADAASTTPGNSQPSAQAQASKPPAGKKGNTKSAAASSSPSASPPPSASPSPSPSALALVGPPSPDDQSKASPSSSPPPSTSPSPSSSPAPSASPSPDASPAALPSTGAMLAAADGSASPSASAAGSAQSIPVTGAFGSVYWGKQDVQNRLGAPQAAEFTISTAELSFQRGSMYAWLGKQTVYIFFSNGTWTPAKVAVAGADAAGEPVQGASNLWIPPAGFNEAWNSTPSVQTDMGYAVSAQARTMQGRVQPFANGAMIYSDSRFVYVIYNNGKWELYPDTSGHGDLITPTPEPSPSSSPSPSPSAAPENDTGSSPAPSDAGSPPASPAGAASAGGNVSAPGS